jgi:cytochrome c-type biogenesis protein
MSSSAPGVAIAFLAGVLSFLTPCVLPLVPGYISFMSGQSLKEMRGAQGRSRLNPHVIITSIGFIIGFSIVFIAFGAAASALGQALASIKPILIRLGGIIIIILGLHVAGLFKIMFLYREKRIQEPVKPGGPLRAFILGIAFAFGWTPCVGPILGGILTLAVSEDTLGHGIMLLVFYSLGMGLPFFLTAVLLDEFFRVFERIKNHLRKIEIGAGALLVITGLFMAINRFDLVKYYLQEILPDFLLRLG